MASLIDNLDRQISRLGKNVLSKGKDMTDSVRLSGLIRESEEKQAEVYRKIGEYVFENYGETEDEMLQAWKNEILQTRMEMQGYKEQLNRLKNVVSCPNCGTAIPADSAFCNACGTRIEKQVQVSREPQGNSGRVCPNCGAQAEGDAAFCTICGTRLQQEGTVEEKKNLCPGCGNELKSGQMFCTNCGMKVG